MGFAVLAGIALVVGFILACWGLVSFVPLASTKMFLGSLSCSVLLMVGFIRLATQRVRKDSSVQRERELAHILVFSLLGLPLLCFGLGMVLNGGLDPSIGTSHRVRVVDKRITSWDCIVWVESWRQHRETERLTVDSTTYFKVTPAQSHMIVMTKPGRFGFEWIASSRVESP